MTKTPRDDSHRDTRRRFEQWARNPQCQANVISAVHNIKMADVAKLEGGRPTMGQSPFAIARGQTFEKALFRDDGAKSIPRRCRKRRCPPEDTEGFVDFRLRLNGGRCHSLDESLRQDRGATARSRRRRQEQGAHDWSLVRR